MLLMVFKIIITQFNIVQIWKKQCIQGIILFIFELFTNVKYFGFYIKSSSEYFLNI